jgi:hypothetical protein
MHRSCGASRARLVLFGGTVVVELGSCSAIRGTTFSEFSNNSDSVFEVRTSLVLLILVPTHFGRG